MISFSIPGQPVPKARARVTHSGHAFTPAKTRAYSDLVAVMCRQAMAGRGPLTGPVALTLTFHLQKPKKMPKGRVEPTAKPDIDNLQKAVMDGMNGIAWADDAQVVAVTARKVYGEPGASVSLAPVGNL